MAYGRNQFIDAAPGGLGAYSWTINHKAEREFGGKRNVERTATTDGIGVVRQQGTDEPLMIQLEGTILDEAQHQAFIAYYAICRYRTIDFVDFAGNRYEVQITSYLPTRVATVRNPRHPVGDGSLHYYTYTLEMDVLTVRSGPWAGMA